HAELRERVRVGPERLRDAKARMVHLTLDVANHRDIERCARILHYRANRRLQTFVVAGGVRDIAKHEVQVPRELVLVRPASLTDDRQPCPGEVERLCRRGARERCACRGEVQPAELDSFTALLDKWERA